MQQEPSMNPQQHDTDQAQAALWNGAAGQAWVDAQALLDRMFQPFEDLLARAVAARAPRTVLDIGCGAGATTLAAARVLGPAGACTGLDISQPLIAAARARADREGVGARFVCADAQRHAFAPDSIDMVISRFGVMFFDDPVQAFGNLRRTAAAAGTLCCIAWRSPAENPFMTTAERAAAPLLPGLPPRKPGAPGQFAFADADRVRRILEDGGWTGVGISPLDVECSFPEPELMRYVTRLGPVGLALADADETTRARVVDTVRAAFAPYVHGTEVRYTAACWMIEASR
jgi:SAM-dependent methyltransferase